MSQANKTVARRWIGELWNTGSLDLIPELASADFVFHRNANPDLKGHAGLREAVTYLRTAFPDGRFTVIEQIAEGDKVVNRMSFEGTHKGLWSGVAGTGRHVTFTVDTTLRIAGSKVSETWTHSDVLGFLKQAGKAPA